MSLNERLIDAMFLWNGGRREGGLLLALVAVAAAARLRYPDSRDGDAFKRFLRESQRFTLDVEFRGELQPIEHILYKWMRCTLVHEAGLPFDIELMPDVEPGVLTVRAGGEPERLLKLSEAWFRHLLDAVAQSAEYRSLDELAKGPMSSDPQQ